MSHAIQPKPPTGGSRRQAFLGSIIGLNDGSCHKSATRTLRPSAARNCARRCEAPGCEGGPGHDVAPACGSRSGMGAARSSPTEAGSRLRWLAEFERGVGLPKIFGY